MRASPRSFPRLKITATLFEIDREPLYLLGWPLHPPRHDDQRHRFAITAEELAVAVAELLLHNLVRHPHDTQRMPVQHRTGISHPKLLAVIAHMEAYNRKPGGRCVILPPMPVSRPRQLERLFREKMGKTPSRYYLELRLQRARLLLLQTTMPILQIAVACGFTLRLAFRALLFGTVRAQRATDRARPAPHASPGLESEPGDAPRHGGR